MALDFGFDLKTFLERTCRACSRYFDDEADIKMIFHRIFSDVGAPATDSDEKPIVPQPSDEIRDIFEEFRVWQLNIQPIDGLPQQICHDCLERFRSVKKFREECVDTQKVLQSYFKDLSPLLQPNALGKYSPRSESLKSEPRVSPAPLSPASNLDYLMPEAVQSPESRLQQLSPFNSPKFQLSPRNVYAESSMGTPPPLFEEIKSEPIDMETLEYMKSEADLQLEMQQKEENQQHKKSPKQYSTSDDESSTPTSDDEQVDDDDAETDMPESLDMISLSSSNYSPRNPLQCRICYAVFAKRTLLKEHHAHVHPQEKPYVCNICGSAFKSNFLLKQHKLKHNRPDSIKCKSCAKCFRSQLHMQRHAKNFHLTSTYTCHICHEKFENYTQLRFQYHVRQHGEKRFHCQTCDKSFHQKIHLINHERTHTKEQPFRCDICGKAYRQQTACQEHMLTHSDPTPFKCQICKKGFTQRSSLRLHYRTHANDDDHFAQQHFEQKSTAMQRYKKRVKATSLKKTRVNNHKILKTVKCQYCDKTFPNNQLQLLHEQQYHKKLKHFTCSFCTEQFRDRTLLGEHMISHLDSETFDDEDTDYTFQNPV